MASGILKTHQWRRLASWAICLVVITLLLGCRNRHDPSSFASGLVTSPEVYSELDEVAMEDFYLRCYYYKDSKRVKAITGEYKPVLADEEGNTPAFKCDGDIFVITDKWVNWSAGLAISDDPGFIKKANDYDSRLAITKIRARVYSWTFDKEMNTGD